MLSKLISGLINCPCITSVTSCALPSSEGSWALMPDNDESIVKHYTDGHMLCKKSLYLYYKTVFSPRGDADYKAEEIMNEVICFINENDFAGFTSVNADNYTLSDTRPSEAVYSIKLTVTYTK